MRRTLPIARFGAIAQSRAGAWLLATLWLGCGACRCGGVAGDSARFALAGAQRMLTFEGTCDASGVVAVSERVLAVVDDEDNVLRSYDAQVGGAPLSGVNLSPSLGLSRRGKRGNWPEADLEAGTRIGARAYWITSHGRSSKGELRPERLRFFATSLGERGEPPQVWGQVYEGLLEDLKSDPKLQRFDLAAASRLSPKQAGGLNIEGLSATPDGQLLIGFRSPNPEQRALLLPLRNPDGVLQGQRAQFGEPILLDMKGRGVRAMVPFHAGYLIVAGHFAHELPSQLYVWDGVTPPRLQAQVEFGDFNPEAIFVPPSGDDVLVLSDDGELAIDGTECKKLPSATRKRFRGAWVRIR